MLKSIWCMLQIHQSGAKDMVVHILSSWHNHWSCHCIFKRQGDAVCRIFMLNLIRSLTEKVSSIECTHNCTQAFYILRVPQLPSSQKDLY